MKDEGRRTKVHKLTFGMLTITKAKYYSVCYKKTAFLKKEILD